MQSATHLLSTALVIANLETSDGVVPGQTTGPDGVVTFDLERAKRHVAFLAYRAQQAQEAEPFAKTETVQAEKGAQDQAARQAYIDRVLGLKPRHQPRARRSVSIAQIAQTRRDPVKIHRALRSP